MTHPESTKAILCACGCGRPVRVSCYPSTQATFIHGHNARKVGPRITFRVNGKTGCWEWEGPVSVKGYGRGNVGGRHPVQAHRLVYETMRGPIPAGLEPDHKCRNRRCVNPDHIDLVTHAENLRRAERTKLDWGKVREMRSLYPAISVVNLARRFGVSHGTAYQVVHRQTWREDVAA